MSELPIKQGWVRALIFIPIWFVTMIIFVGLGTVAMMMIAGVDAVSYTHLTLPTTPYV